MTMERILVNAAYITHVQACKKSVCYCIWAIIQK